MFDALTDKFNHAFRTLSGRGRISEENVREAMREVRTALLEADVNLDVVKTFTDHVIDKALGQEVIKSLQPGQLMVKIVYDELLALLGPVDTSILFVTPGPTVLMMCGLQGAGKTTTCGKLARYLVAKGHHPLLAAADLQRPAAVRAAPRARRAGRRARSTPTTPRSPPTARWPRGRPWPSAGPPWPRPSRPAATWSSSTPPAGWRSTSRSWPSCGRSTPP